MPPRSNSQCVLHATSRSTCLEGITVLRRRQLNSSVAMTEVGRRDRLLNTLPSCPRASVTLLEKRCYVGASPVFDRKSLSSPYPLSICAMVAHHRTGKMADSKYIGVVRSRLVCVQLKHIQVYLVSIGIYVVKYDAKNEHTHQ